MAHTDTRRVTKTFQDGDGEIVAVDDISLDIDDGEFLVSSAPRAAANRRRSG